MLKANADISELLDTILVAKDSTAQSKSQLKQDIFVLLESDFKKNGYFVEFGATDGIYLSNTYLLEKSFAWTGILAEPGRNWQADLSENRDAAIEHDCVWSKTGESLTFNMTSDQELSTLDAFSGSDGHAKSRADGKRYTVNTISLLDMLKRHNAPREIDYLSVDTEGSEYEILKSFDFDAYNIRIISVEHNFTPMREKIFELLSAAGYVRKYPGLSKWDDWYVRST